MSDITSIKAQLMRLVAEGRADEAWEFAETVRDDLSVDEISELELWIAQNAYESFQPPQEAEANRAKWLKIADHMKPGETLRDALPRLPQELQDFLEAEVKRSSTVMRH